MIEYNSNIVIKSNHYFLSDFYRHYVNDNDKIIQKWLHHLTKQVYFFIVIYIFEKHTY